MNKHKEHYELLRSLEQNNPNLNGLGTSNQIGSNQNNSINQNGHQNGPNSNSLSNFSNQAAAMINMLGGKGSSGELKFDFDSSQLYGNE